MTFPFGLSKSNTDHIKSMEATGKKNMPSTCLHLTDTYYKHFCV